MADVYVFAFEFEAFYCAGAWKLVGEDLGEGGKFETCQRSVVENYTRYLTFIRFHHQWIRLHSQINSEFVLILKTTSIIRNL